MSANNENIYTQEGLEQLEEEIKEVEERLKEVRRGRHEAFELERDWHDNFAFEQAERDERLLANRLQELSEDYRVAKVVKETPDENVIEIGSTVEIELEGEARRQTFTIRGHSEGEPESGVISFDSPMGQALLGAGEGDVRAFEVEDSEHAVRVLRVTADFGQE
jgi:transcription elongation factor GreA